MLFLAAAAIVLGLTSACGDSDDSQETSAETTTAAAVDLSSSESNEQIFVGGTEGDDIPSPAIGDEGAVPNAPAADTGSAGVRRYHRA